MNINKFISNKEKLLTNKITNPKHIALCFDRNYAMPAGILITSIIANNTDLNFHFHLFALSIDDDDKQKFSKIEGKTEITLYHVNSSFNDIEYANRNGSLPISTNIRLIVPSLLRDKTDHLLYLDCDMLCTGKLEKLFETDISNYIAACVLDVGDLRENLSKNIGLKNNNYFNAGMLYINRKRWCEEKVTKHTLSLLGKNRYDYLDQDVLNIVLNGKFLIIDNTFNYLSGVVTKYDMNYFGKTQLLNEVVLFHFVGGYKPWFKLYMNSVYHKYLKKSPWSDRKIKFAPNHSTIRIFSKHLMKEKRYISSVRYFLIYIFFKLHKI